MYLDPGSWSMAFQILVGAVLSIPLLVGVYWGRIKERFFNRSKDANSNKE